MPSGAILVLTAVLALSAPATSAAAVRLLPDLDQAAPRGLTVHAAGGGRYHLGFESATENRGVGPLEIRGAREPSEAQMAATQVVRLSDGTTESLAGAGSLAYVTSPSHDHWHLEPFAGYELRRLDDGSLAAPDQKTGFCLTDSYRVLPPVPAAPSIAQYQGRCGLSDPDLLSVTEGISVGHADLYAAHVDGQYVDITGLPAARYLLVHRANHEGKIVESDYANNASSLVVELAWPNGPGGAPRVTSIASCPATDTCEAPAATQETKAEEAPVLSDGTSAAMPTLNRRRAARAARRAVASRFGRSGSIAERCRRRSRTSFLCSVSWRRGRFAYRGGIRIRYRLEGGKVALAYAMRILRTDRRCRRSGGSRCALTRTFESDHGGSNRLSRSASASPAGLCRLT